MTVVNEPQVEYGFIGKLADLKYTYRADIRDRNSLELNFRRKFEALNRVNLSDAEFARLRDEIITSDVFAASKILRQKNTFMREDGTPLQYTLVDIRDWCKNEYEVINQFRINTKDTNHRYDVILLINGRYSRRVSMDEIEQNGYNLNISRYVSTSVDEEVIDLAEVNKQLVDIDKKIADARNRHNAFLKELGLKEI